MSNRIIVSEAALNLHRVAAKERGRYALNGVHINADGTACAADGRMLLAVGPVPDSVAAVAGRKCDFDHDGLQGGVLVPADQLKEARKNLPAKKYSRCEEQRTTAELATDGDTVSITTTGQHRRTIEGTAVEGQFPDYSTIIKGSGNTRARISFNACIMEQLCSAMRRASGQSKSGKLDVTLELRNRDEPMIMRGTTTNTGQELVAALSPVVPDDYNTLKDDPEQIADEHDTPSRWEQLLDYPGTVRREVSALWSIADGAADRADRLTSWRELHNKLQCERDKAALPAPVDTSGPAVRRAQEHVHNTVRRFHGAAAPHAG